MQKYCSKVCARFMARTYNHKRWLKEKSKPVIKQCINPNCGKDFVYKPGQKYCTRQCYREVNFLGERDLICEYCGSTFKTHKTNKRFCSGKCRNRSNWLNVRRVKNIKKYGIQICAREECNETFEWGSNRKFCSKECARIEHNRKCSKKQIESRERKLYNLKCLTCFRMVFSLLQCCRWCPRRPTLSQTAVIHPHFTPIRNNHCHVVARWGHWLQPQD